MQLSDSKSLILLQRIAKYHNAVLVTNDLDRGLYFKFKCENEAMTWKVVYFDKNGLHGNSPFGPETKPYDFLQRYIKRQFFFRTCGQSKWSDDFNMFGPRMIEASSVEELELKLAIRGF